MLRSDVEACVSLCEFVFICFRLLYFLEVLQIASGCLRFLEVLFGCLSCVEWSRFLIGKLGCCKLFHVI